jgi:hypothetical protein
MSDRQNLNNAGFSDYRAIEANNGMKPVEVSEAFYWEMLEVLPPCKWTRGQDYESFYVSEPLTGILHEWIARVGKKYYALIAPRSSNHEQIINQIKEATA